MFQQTFIKVVEQLGNSFLATIQITIYITLYTECHEIYMQYMSKKDCKKYQYLELKRSWTRADMYTCFNAPTDHTATVKQVTIVVHGVTHTSTYMQPHIPNIKTLTPYWIFTQIKISLKLSHINNMGMIHGQCAMLTLQTQTGMAAPWTMRSKKAVLFSAAHTFPRLVWAGHCYWVSVSRPCSPTNSVASKHVSIATIQR